MAEIRKQDLISNFEAHKGACIRKIPQPAEYKPPSVVVGADNHEMVYTASLQLSLQCRLNLRDRAVRVQRIEQNGRGCEFVEVLDVEVGPILSPVNVVPNQLAARVVQRVMKTGEFVDGKLAIS